MDRLMDGLYSLLKNLVEHRLFKGLMSLIILANPIALAPQVWVALTAPSVEGISITMWVIFLAIQSALMFNGIRLKDWSVFLSMAVSLLESTTIIIVVLLRS